MDAASIVKRGFESTYERLKRCAADLTDEEARRVLAGQLTGATWQIGHTALIDANVVRRAGGTFAVPDGYESLFKMGSGGSAAYPPLADLLNLLERTQAALLQIAATGDYARPVEGQNYSNVGEMLVFNCVHRGYHIGKLTTIRALLGKPRLFG
ncbi:MAG TPA: DinB family protein [bacterium]|nr:DinB family protein [bacterium]